MVGEREDGVAMGGVIQWRIRDVREVNNENMRGDGDVEERHMTRKRRN